MNNTLLQNTLSTLKKNKLHAVKKFGQNFLIDKNIINKIVESSKVNKKTCVIEVGPGLGALTEALVEKASKVIAFEIDKKLVPILEDKFKDKKNLEIIGQDFLKTNLVELFKKLKKEYDEIRIVANLPYYITSQILVKILLCEEKINSCTLMMQKELAERLSAPISTKKYNNFSILIQHFSNPQIIFNVPPKVFIPEPKVTSTVVFFDVKKERLLIENETEFFAFIKKMFSQKRKTILNNLGNYTSDKAAAKEILEKVEINPSLRPENISTERFLKIYNEITR